MWEACRRSVEREHKREETRDDPEPSAEYFLLVTLTIFDFATTRDNSPCVQRATCMQHNPDKTDKEPHTAIYEET